MKNENVKYLLNKHTLKISQINVNGQDKELIDLLTVENRVYNTHGEAVKMQSYFDTNVKFN